MSSADRVLVPSLTRAGESWRIERRADGTLSCSCPAHSFGRRKGEPCKHLGIVSRADDLIARCSGLHGTGGVLCRQCLVSLLAVATRRVAKRYVLKPERRSKREKPDP